MNDAAIRTITIVDDDEPVRDSMRTLLESYGFAVRDFDSALALLGDRHAADCDCLLFDLHMPEMTGLELLELLRSRGVRTPALLITGKEEALLEPRISRAGILHLLHKPVSDEQLLQWIDRACTE